jgi:hypothetical protein
MRETTKKHRKIYCTLPRAKRREYLEAVLYDILAKGARFLMRVHHIDQEEGAQTGEMWEEVSRTIAHDKVSHSLQEKTVNTKRAEDAQRDQVTTAGTQLRLG